MCPKNALKAEFKGLWVGQEILETNLTALSNVRLPPGQIKCTWFKKLSICLCSGQVQIVYSVWAVNLEMLQGSSHESLSITTTYSLSPTFYISWLLMWYKFRNGNRILWRDTLIWGLRIKTMTRFESGHPCWLTVTLNYFSELQWTVGRQRINDFIGWFWHVNGWHHWVVKSIITEDSNPRSHFTKYSLA